MEVCRHVSPQAEVSRMHSATEELTLTLADVFAEDSESERTFYGFSDNEISEHYNKVSNLS